MIRHVARVITFFALLGSAPLLSAQIPFLSTSHNRNQSSYNCQGLELKDASGVPHGTVHKYSFVGPCKLLSLGISDNKIKSSKLEGTVWAKAAVSWDSATGEMRESFLISGDRSGKLQMTLHCTKDPVITTVTCVPGAYVNETGWPGFDVAWLSHHPITQGRANAVEAAAVALQAEKQKAGSNPAVPPPPKTASSVPPDKKMAKPSPLQVVEGEQLVATAKTDSDQPPRVQGMSQFGKEWSGNAQLFWPARLVSSRMRLKVPLNMPAGRYEVFIAFTQAPDYGLIEASFDGQPTVHFNGYAKTVSRNRALLGMFDLTPGDHDLVLTIAGKDGNSSGFFLGLDRMEFAKR